MKFAIALLLLVSTTSLARDAELARQGDEGTRGGGDPALISEYEYQLVLKNEYGGDLKNFIETGLRKELQKYLGAINDSADNFIELKANPALQVALIRLRGLGLDRDIEQTPPYVVRRGCTDSQGQSKGASTLNGVKNAEICFDPEVLRQRRTTLAQLVGIAFHEHGRHLGVSDEDHALAYAVSSTFKIVTVKRASYAFCTFSQLSYLWDPSTGLVGPKDDFWTVATGKPQNVVHDLSDQYWVVLDNGNPQGTACDGYDPRSEGRESESVVLQVRRKSQRAPGDVFSSSLVAEASAYFGGQNRNYPYFISLSLGELNLRVTCENK